MKAEIRKQRADGGSVAWDAVERIPTGTKAESGKQKAEMGDKYGTRWNAIPTAKSAVLPALLACILVAVCLPTARGDILYNNSSTRETPERFAHSGFEFGDEIILAGSVNEYIITNFQFEYFGFGPDFTNGNAFVTLRFYKNDGVDGIPNTKI